MRNKMLRLGAFAMLLASTVHAQDITGDWQGTFKAGPKGLRVVVQIAKEEGGAWKAKMYSIDQGTDPIHVSSVTLEGSTIKLIVEAVRGTYEGKLSSDGTFIRGTWTQGEPLPLELRRATKETAWPLDPTRHTVRYITVDNNVKLEVLD